MNRRQLIATTGISLELLLTNNRLALASMQTIAAPTRESSTRPRFEFDDFSQVESLYLGTLFTWLELLEDTIDALYEGIDAFDSEPESETAKSMMLMPLGVWRHLALDTQKFDAPASFSETHGYNVMAFSHLGSAAEIIATGVVAGNATAIMLGTEHINLASDEIAELISALPFDRPQRSELLT